MEIAQYISNMATNISNQQLATNISTSLIKKTMDVQESAAQNLIEQMNTPIFPGEPGYLFNARA